MRIICKIDVQIEQLHGLKNFPEDCQSHHRFSFDTLVSMFSASCGRVSRATQIRFYTSTPLAHVALYLLRFFKKSPTQSSFPGSTLVLVHPQPQAGRRDGHHAVLGPLRRVRLHEVVHVEVTAVLGGLLVRRNVVYDVVVDLDRIIIPRVPHRAPGDRPARGGGPDSCV